MNTDRTKTNLAGWRAMRLVPDGLVPACPWFGHSVVNATFEEFLQRSSELD